MKEVTQEPKEQLIKQLQKFLSLTYYLDQEYLDAKKLLKKYGHIGGDFPDRIDTRFRRQDFAFEAVNAILKMADEYYFIPVVDDIPMIYHASRDDIRQYMSEYNNDTICHFIVIDSRLEWMMIKNSYNKIIGSGKIIKDKLKSILDNIDYKRVFYLYTERV